MKRRISRIMVIDDIHAKIHDDASWMVDTGAARHLVTSKKLLQKNQQTLNEGFNIVKGFSGQISVISAIGYSYLRISAAQHIELSDVLYVPNCKSNLVSVSRLTADYPFSVIFNSSGFVVKDFKTKKEVAKGHLVNRGHYFWPNVLGFSAQSVGEEEIWKGVLDAAGYGFLMEYTRKLAARLKKLCLINFKIDPFEARDAWLVDSGAAAHMTNNAKLLRNLRRLSENKFQSDFEGRISKATHSGDVYLPSQGDQEIILRGVLLVPDSILNIISVSKFISDHPCCFEFTSDGFVLKTGDEKNKLMAKGQMIENFYWWLNKKN